ncbi:MAG: hypothetical protein LBI31_04390 [Zoogloeaceae bacterium]|nr:hypothetical protein [Zoogloeaceae bacterium]
MLSSCSAPTKLTDCEFKAGLELHAQETLVFHELKNTYGLGNGWPVVPNFALPDYATTLICVFFTGRGAFNPR